MEVGLIAATSLCPNQNAAYIFPNPAIFVATLTESDFKLLTWDIFSFVDSKK